MRFGSEMSISEVLKEIRTKLDEVQGGKDHGLFLPKNEETGKAGKWLEKNKTLKYYSLQNNTVVEFKKKHRPLRIRLIDDTTKLVIIDDSKTVREISDSIGEKIGLKSFEEFSLRKPPPNPTDTKPLWLDEQKPLHEQGVKEEDELEYAKKFYFSDDFIDKDDPFSLHLLYVEANKSVLTGKYSITRTDAKDFAALQLQIVYGDHDPAKHVPGFFEVDKFLPEDFRKDKKIVADILRDHRKLVGMNEMSAKFRYVQLVRSLKTYGITYFDCNLRVKGKKKMVPILIGITREKIMKVEPGSIRIIKEWTWQQMRRWSSIKNTFVLDFGDYEEDYLNLVTDDADSMASLIGGYIDIILRTRVDKARVVEHDDDDVAEEEQLTATYGVAHTGVTSAFNQPYGSGASQMASMGPGGMGSRQPGGPQQSSQIFPQTNKINVTDLPSAQKAAQTLASELGSAPVSWGAAPSHLSEQDLDKQFLTHKTNLANGLNDLLGQARLGPNNLNRNQLDAKSKELAMELRSIATCAKHLSSLNPDKVPLLDGAKAVADSVADLLKLMMGASEAPNSPGFEPALEAVEKQVKAAQMLLENATLLPHVDEGTKLLLLEAIYGINQNLDLVLDEVEKEAVKVGREGIKPHLLAAQAVLAPAISTMSTLVPYANDPLVRQQLNIAHATIDNLGKEVLAKAQQAGINPIKVPDLKDAADRLADSLAILLQSLDSAEKQGIPSEANLHSPAFTILENLSVLRDAIDDPKKVAEAVKPITAANNDLALAIPLLTAHVNDPEELQREGVTVAAGVQELNDASKFYAKRPHDLEAKEKVLAAATALEVQAHLLLEGPAAATALSDLRYQTKTTAAVFVKLLNIASRVAPEIGDPALKQHLKNNATQAQKILPELLAAAGEAAARPNNIEAQSKLLKVANKHAPALSDLAATSKKAAREVTNLQNRDELDTAASDAQKYLRSLLRSVQEVSDLRGETDIESALGDFQSVKADLESAYWNSEQGLLKPLPGQSREAAVQQLMRTINDDLAHNIMDLAKAAKSGQPVGKPAGQAAISAESLGVSVKAVAASIVGDREGQRTLIGLAKHLVDDIVNLVSLGRTLSRDVNSQPKNQAFARGLAQYQATLGSLKENAQKVNPGDIDRAMETIQKAAAALNARPKNAPGGPGSGGNFGQLTDQLVGATKALNGAVSNLVGTSRAQPEFLGYKAKVTGAAAAQVLQIAASTAAASSDRALQEALLASARELANSLNKLLPSCVDVAQKKNPVNLEKLTRNASEVSDAIDDVLQAVGRMGQAESAASQLLNTIYALDSDRLDVIPGSRQDVLNEIITCSKDLSRVQQNLVNSAAAGDSKVGIYAKDVGDSAAKILMAAKAAVVAADGGGEFLHLDAARVSRGADYLISNPKEQSKVEGISKQITKAIGNLISSAKSRAHEESDPARRQAIVKTAQKVVQDATTLAEAARSASRDQNNSDGLVNAAKTLKNDVRALQDAMKVVPGSPTDPNVIDKQTAAKLLAESRALAVASAELLRSSIQTCADPEAPKAKEELYRKSDTTSAALQNLLKVTGSLNPVVQRVDRAIEISVKASSDLDAASANIQSGGKMDFHAGDKSLKEFQADVLAVCKQVAFDMKELLIAANKSPEELISSLEKFEKNPPNLATYTLALAGVTNDNNQKLQHISCAKHLTDNLTAFLRSIKSAALNDPNARADMTKNSDAAAKALGLLLQQVQSGAQLTAGLEKNAAEIKSSVDSLRKPGLEISYPEAREQLTVAARDLAGHVTTLISTDKRNAGELGIVTSRVAESVGRLMEGARTAAASTSEEAAAAEILKCAAEVGHSVASSVIISKEMTEGTERLRELLESYNSTNVGISNLLSAAKKGAVGEKLMDNAINTAKDCLLRINQADILSRASQLGPSEEATQVPMNSLQSQLATAVKQFPNLTAAVKEHTKSDERELTDAVVKLSSAIQEISDVSTMIASRAADPQSRAALVEGARDLVAVATDIMTSAKHIQSSPKDQNEVQKSLARAHRSIEEKSAKIAAVLEASSTENQKEIRELDASKQQLLSIISAGDEMPGKSGASPDDVMSAARDVLRSVGKFTYSTKPNEIVVAGKEIQENTKKFLAATKGASELSDDLDVQQGLVLAGVNTARLLTDLLDAGKAARDDQGVPEKLEDVGGKVASSINTFVYALKKLPNTEDIQLEQPNDDLDSLAESELLRCADIIAKAAETLRSYRPPPRDKKLTGGVDQQDISEAILDAAMAIAQATGQLVQTAAVAQQERTKLQKSQGSKYHTDPMWAQGLVSAAQSVAAAVQQLVKSANSAVGGSAEEEALVASARAVATATAHLVSASRAKADPNTETQRRLRGAAKSVTDATSSLVSAAATAAEFNRPEEVIEIPDISSAKGKVLEMEQEMKIKKLENDLDTSRRQLHGVRKQRYRKN